MSDDSVEFHRNLLQDVFNSADVSGTFLEDSFFDRFCEHIIDAGELETADRSPYFSPRGLRVDGYGGDPALTEGELSLIILDFNPDEAIGTLTATEMKTLFDRVTRFVEKSLDVEFVLSLEETDPGYGLADLINNRWGGIRKIRLFLLSNRVLSSRVEGREAGTLRGVPVTYNVWDLDRLHRLIMTGREREDLVIDFEDSFGVGINVLPAHLEGAGYESYLAVLPGATLAAIYERWGARLLESNVRFFLQARSGVNKGIRNTILNEPEMFLAYNNGLAATAEAVDIRRDDEGIVMTRVQNLQIVNGGQTTASIHAASRKGTDLSRVFVQMKLSIVPSVRSLEVVPKISEYANSQNRINAADFFANHPFHIRFEEFSRRVFAPSPDGTFRQSKWFYERARGQYRDERARMTPAQRKSFDLEFPRSQLFVKTDLAKFLNVWRGKPEKVSQGAQKNFAEFAGDIGKEWGKSETAINEQFYKEAIAKAIVFKRMERVVPTLEWYQGGYRANVVAYAIAKLAHDVEARGMAVDFDKIWRKQGVPAPLERALLSAATAVHGVITSPPAGVQNVTEWAKKSACWTRVQGLEVDWPHDLWGECLGREEERQQKREAGREQRVLNGIEAQMVCVRAAGEFWSAVLNWGMEHRQGSEKERGILRVMTRIPRVVPSELQCMRALEVFERFRAEGLPLTLPDGREE